MEEINKAVDILRSQDASPMSQANAIRTIRREAEKMRNDYLAIQKQLHDLEDAVRYVILRTQYEGLESKEDLGFINKFRARNGDKFEISKAIKNSEARQ
jgi:hypothetical protein